MVNVNENYDQRTVNSKNALVRFAHRRRLKHTLATVPYQTGDWLLDFGCGDGKFLSQFLNRHVQDRANIFGFEPYMEAGDVNTSEIIRDWSDVVSVSKKASGFDTVTCLEVLEHFSPSGQRKILSDIISVMKPGGLLLVSCPVEKGFPSIVKNIIRRLRFGGEYYRFRDIIRSAIGIPIPEKRMDGEYLGHMGFYFDDLEKIISESFDVVSKEFQPFIRFGYNVNSQVFFKCILRDS